LIKKNALVPSPELPMHRETAGRSAEWPGDDAVEASLEVHVPVGTHVILLPALTEEQLTVFADTGRLEAAVPLGAEGAMIVFLCDAPPVPRP
jgi:hypothetical protein